MKFEWDMNKSVENVLKHGVSFEEAQKAFFDAKRKIYRDEKHSLSEERYFCFGMVEGFHGERRNHQDYRRRILAQRKDDVL